MHLHSKILKQKQFPQKIWIIQPFRSTGTHSEIREVCFLVSLECALIYSPPVDLKYCDDAMMDDTGSMFSRDCWRWWQGAWWMWGHGPLWLGWHSFPLMFTLQVRSQAPWNADTWCLHTRTLLWWPFHHWSSITQMGHQVFRNQTQNHPSLYLSFFIVWFLDTPHIIHCLQFTVHQLWVHKRSNDQCYSGIRGGWFYYWAVSWEPFCGILSKFDLSDTIIKWQYSILGLNWSISLLFKFKFTSRRRL